MTTQHPHAFLLRVASLASVMVAAILILGKTIAWWYTESLSLQASLVDSLLDILASLINLFVIHQALKPPDKDHRFGHGKAEALGSLGQATFIMGSALWLLLDVFHRLLHPQPLAKPELGFVVMIVAIILTGGLIFFQRYVIHQTQSMAISADSLHYQTDLYTNIGVLLSLFLSSKFHMPWIDVLVAIVIIAYICVTSVQIGLKALDVLMDKELSDPIRQTILEIATSHPMVLGVHDLRTRSSGSQWFVQMHLDIIGSLSLWEAHKIGDEVRDHICQKFPNADVIIHHDPRSNKQ